MARPTQKGLNYFPLDVNMDQNQKMAIIEADYGLEGFGIILKLLMKIYTEGYFYPWGEKQLKLFAHRIYRSRETVQEVVEAGLRWGLFNQKLFDDYGILTSRGIQTRYFEAACRRKNVLVVEEYLLITNKELEKYSQLNAFDHFLSREKLNHAPRRKEIIPDWLETKYR